MGHVERAAYTFGNDGRGSDAAARTYGVPKVTLKERIEGKNKTGTVLIT
jgi:hypothetical protein